MRHTQRVVLLAVTALMAIAAMAPAANATGNPVVLKQSGVTCPAVTKVGTTVTGGCLVQWSDPSVDYGTSFGSAGGSIDHTCQVNLSGRVDGAGHGWITSVTFPTCGTFAPCELPWEIQFHKNGNGTFHGHTFHCAVSGQYRGGLELSVTSSLGLNTIDDRLLPGSVHPTYGWMGKTLDGHWTVSSPLGAMQLS
jgi:hypothetical protein